MDECSMTSPSSLYSFYKLEHQFGSHLRKVSYPAKLTSLPKADAPHYLSHQAAAAHSVLHSGTAD